MEKEKNDGDESKERKRRGKKERERSESRDRSSRPPKRVESKKRGKQKTLESIQHLNISKPSDSDMTACINEGIVPPVTQLVKEYSCQIDVEYPETEAEKRAILSRIEILIQTIHKSDVDLKFIKEIIQEENEEEYMFMDFLPSVDFKELPWSSVRFKADSLKRGSTMLDFSLTFLKSPRNTDEISVYRVMELIILTSIEKLQFIKSVDINETATTGTVFLSARMTSSLPSLPNESVQRMLNELRGNLRLISGESVSGHVATEKEIESLLKSLLEKKGDQIEILSHLTPSSMRKIVKDSLITEKDVAQVSIEIVGASPKAKRRNIPSTSYWLFPFNFRKLSDLPSDTFNEISNLTDQLPTRDHIWYKGFLSKLVGLTFSTSDMLNVMRKIVSSAWPYPEILDSYSNHEGTLGGLIEALDKFEACVEKQEEKETISNYKCEIEKIRENMYDEIIRNVNCPSQLLHVKTMEDFEEMHRKLKLKIKTNEMKMFGEIKKKDLEEGDQLWIFRKRRFMKSYAHVVIISDGGKYIHVKSPYFKWKIRARAAICEEHQSAINDEDLCFVVKPIADNDPTVCKKRAKACIGIRFDYDGETETCETFCNGVHGQWSDNIQIPRGITQNRVDDFTKISTLFKTKEDPLCVQMKRKIQEEKLIFPYEQF